MGQASFHTSAWNSFAPAGMTPVIGFKDAALKNCFRLGYVLPSDGQPELVKTAESSKVSRVEGTLEHVEVFLMVSVVTSIMKDLDLLSINDPREHPNTPSIMKSRLCLCMRRFWAFRRKSPRSPARITQSDSVQWGFRSNLLFRLSAPQPCAS